MLGLLLSQFPRYDETFILREVTALSQANGQPVIFSLRLCRDRVIHADATQLQSRTVYAPFVWSHSVWRSQAIFLRRTPRAYWGAVWWIMSRHWRHPAILLKTLAFFPKTVHFARLMVQRGVTHVHAFWATYPATSAMIIQRLTGIPYSVSGHAHDLYTTNPTLVEKLRGARFVVTCTEANRDYLHRLTQGASCPIYVNYHGVDLSRFAPAPKRPGGTLQILSVGSLLPCKGYETLVDACRILRHMGVAFRCTIAGGGPLQATLRRQIWRRGLGAHVQLTGYVTQEVVAALYQQAQLFVLPLVSRIHWGIPNVLIEALATKTPVICCDLPSMRELVAHGDSGWIIPERNPRALAEAIAALGADAALRQQLATSGYQRVAERFSLQRTGQALRELLVRP